MRAEDISAATNFTLAGSEISIALPPTALLAIARLVLELMVAEGLVLEPAPESEYLTPAEAADFMRCDRQRIYDLLSSRRLPKYPDGSRVLVKRTDINNYLGAR